MADIGAHADQVVHDPHWYSKKLTFSGLPAHAQARYRQYGERKMEAQHSSPTCASARKR